MEGGTYLVQPWLAAAAWKAFNTTSTIRWDVRTFPPHTAAVREGANRGFCGILTTMRSMAACMLRTGRTFQRNKASSIERNVDVEHRTHTVYHSRVHDRDRRV